MRAASVCCAIVAIVCFLSTGSLGSEDPRWLAQPAHVRAWKPIHLGSSTLLKERSHTFTIALKQSNLDLLLETFKQVSNPLNKRYGQYLSLDELRKIVSPSEAAIDKITAWLSEHGATRIDLVATRDALKVSMPIGELNRMLSVNLRPFQHQKDGRILFRSLTPVTIPSHIAPHIDLILGVTQFPVPSNRKRISTSSAKKHQSTPTKTSQQASSLQPTRRDSAGFPIISLIMIGTTFVMNFQPQCQNGGFPTTFPLCDDQGGLRPSALILTATPANAASDPGWYQSINFGEISCNKDPVSQNITCSTNADAGWLPWYVPVNISSSIRYGDSVGPEVGFPFSVIRTPPVTPKTLNQLYNIPENFRSINASNSQCVVEFEQQYYSESDLQMFFSIMGVPNDAPVTVIGPNPGPAGGEANLDIQWIMAIARGAPTTFWSIAANSTEEIDDILTWEFAVGNSTNPPLVNSISYGMTSKNVDKFLGDGYLARSDVEFQKLALRGITILIASGDTGAGDLGPPPMSNPTCDTLNPDWPSQSPYVLSVGSTIITPEAEPICYLPASLGGIDCSQNPLGEITVSLEQGLFWTSGGGFSNETPRPDYQAGIVDDYLTQCSALGLLPPSNMWNSSNRGYPDVAAVGHNLMVVQGGVLGPADGTSASAPIFAGILTLLNDWRLNNNKPPLGFVNPLLYLLSQKVPQTFYDVTVGSNRCGFYGFDPLCCDAGYHALPGWDATSGIGTPNFWALFQVINDYPKSE